MTQEDVMDRHPKIFRERNMSPQETCMCWGLEVGEGWLPVIDQGCRAMETVERLYGVSVIAQQVKQKFGGLRFYYLLDSDLPDEKASKMVRRIVRAMENECSETCERCGEKPATTKGSKGWIVCLCDECRNRN